MGHSRAMRGRAMQSLYKRRESPVVCIDKVAYRSVAQAGRHADLFLPAVELVFGSVCCRTHLGRHRQHSPHVLFLVLMVWLAVLILLCVNVEQGRTDTRNYHAEEHVDESEL